MSKQPKYDPEALKNDIKREDKNIQLFLLEIEKAKERKKQLEVLLLQSMAR